MTTTCCRGIILGFLLFLLVGIVQANNDASANDDNNTRTTRRVRVRHSHNTQILGQPQPQANHRQLAEFRTPYTITWRIAIGNGGTDRQPTLEEYEWVVQATKDWFVYNIDENYGDVAGLELTDLEAALVMDQTSWTPAAPEFPHEIFIELEAIWEADNSALVPEVANFLITLNDNSSVRDFIVDYLLKTGTNSVFHFSQRVSYTTATIGAAGPAPGTTPSPVPVPNTIPPTPNVPTPNFAAGWIIPVMVTYDLAIGLGQTDRQPTDAEYEGFLVTFERWLMDSLRAAYASETEFWVHDIESFVTGTSWDATKSTPHKIIIESFVIVTADTLSQVPTLAEFFVTMRSSDVSFPVFINPYLRNAQPPDSIFRYVTSGGYTSEQNGPRFSAAITANPAAPPAPPSPTPAPVRATPQPVNPQEVIVASTGVIRSNWTYTIGGFGIEDRQPTQAEYIGLVDSTHEWLNRILRRHYNDAANAALNLPTFVGAETTLVQGIYQPAETSPHLVIMDIEFTFAVDADDETERMPFIDDVWDVVEAADLNQYVILYVHSSLPRSSVFHGVNSVNWAYSVEDYIYVPRPTRPPSPGGVGSGPGDGGYTNVDRTQLQDAEWVSVSLLMQYRLTDAAAATEGAATEAEWHWLGEATRQFWIDTFESEYESDPASNFVIVDAKWEPDSTTYDSTAELYKYQGRFVTDVLFADGSTVLNNIDMRRRMADLLFGSNYIAGYVHTLSMPVPNLFRNTLQVGWDF